MGLTTCAQVSHLAQLPISGSIDQWRRLRQPGSIWLGLRPGGGTRTASLLLARRWQIGAAGVRHLCRLSDTARSRGLRYMHGGSLSENSRMLAFVSSLGFVLSAHPDDPAPRRGVLVLN